MIIVCFMAENYQKSAVVDRGKYGSGRISTRKNSDDRQVLFKCTGGPSHLAFPPPHGPPPAADIMKATASHLRSSQVCLSAATSCQEPRRRLRAKSSNRHAHSLAGLPRTRGPRGLQLRTRVTQRSSGNLATYCANV